MKLSLTNVLNALNELVVVWINQILYQKQIYPSEIYLKSLSFGLVVYCSRNPALNDYLQKVAQDFLKLLVEGDGANQLSIIIYDSKSNRDKERYVLNFGKFPSFNKYDYNLNELLNLDESDQQEIKIAQFSWSSIYSQFKSILYALQNELKRANDIAERELKNLPNEHDPNDLFFKVVVDTTQDLSSNNDWIKAQQLDDPNIKIATRAKLTRIGEVETGFICIGATKETVK